MKKLVKNLLAACMCLSMAFTAVPAVNSGESGAGIFNAQTVQAAKTGLYHEENGWNYYEDGEWSNATTLVKYNGSWWYVEDGSINFDAETLVKSITAHGGMYMTEKLTLMHVHLWNTMAHGGIYIMEKLTLMPIPWLNTTGSGGV